MKEATKTAGTTQSSGEARPFDSERLLRAAALMHSRRTFGSEEEETEFLAGFAGKSVADVQKMAGLDNIEMAQEFAFQAMESDEVTVSKELALKALALDSDCMDALGVIAATESKSNSDYLDRLKSLLTRAESAIDPLTARAFAGRLWGVLDARPYLRLKFATAQLLERAGKPKEAIRCFEELLSLDTTDAQKVRYQLVRLYGERSQVKPLGRLLRTFGKDTSPVMAWARVLELVQSDKLDAALKALQSARKRNAHVEDILVGRSRPPRISKASAAPGSPEEAAEALRFLAKPWTGDRKAMFWLLKGGGPL